MEKQVPTVTKRQSTIGSLYIILSAVLFGFMPLLTKVAYAHGSNSYTAAFGRFLFGTLFLGIIILFKKGEHLRIDKGYILPILKMAIPYALVPILLYESYNHIGSGLATTLHFTYPAAVLLILFLFFRERPHAVQLICVALSIGGMVLLYKPGEAVSPLGIIYAIASGIVYAVYITLLGQSRAKELPPLVLAFWISALSMLEIGAAALLTGNLTFQLDSVGWGAEMILALTATVLALVLFQQGVILCGPVKASLFSPFEPITSIAVGIALFGERITLREGLGIAAILSSVILYANSGAKEKD